MFPTIAYLDWIAGRPEAATHDLGSSDLRGRPSSGVGPVPDRLASLDDPPASETVATLVAAEYGVDPANVLVTPGASTANALAMATAVDDHAGGDGSEDGYGPQILVEKPGYEPLVATPTAFGGTIHRFRRTADADYRLEPTRVESALSPDDACLAVVTNRHNPSGATTPTSDLATTAEHVSAAGGRLLVDEVYAPFTLEPTDDGAFGGPTAAGLDDVVVTGSLTKFFGFGGLRVGWLVADEAFVERAEQVAHHVPALADPSLALARRALAHADALLADRRELAAENHDRLATFVAERDDVDGVVHDGSTYALVSATNADGDGVSGAAWDAGVLVVPGRFFDEPDSVRVSLGRSPQESDAALAAFGRVLDGLA